MRRAVLWDVALRQGELGRWPMVSELAEAACGEGGSAGRAGRVAVSESALAVDAVLRAGMSGWLVAATFASAAACLVERLMCVARHPRGFSIDSLNGKARRVSWRVTRRRLHMWVIERPITTTKDTTSTKRRGLMIGDGWFLILDC